MRWVIKDKDRGSVLVMVIVCLTFLGVLGTMMLSTTTLNRQMKTVNTMSKANFYSAETVLDEFRMGLEERAEDILAGAYEEMLLTYTYTPESERINKLKKSFIRSLYTELNSLKSESTSLRAFVKSQSDIDNFGRYELLLDDDWIMTVPALDDIEWDKKVLEVGDPYVLIKDLTVTFEDKKGYETSITTDIKLHMKLPSLESDEDQGGIEYQNDYIIIADGTVTKEDVVKSNLETTDLYGKIYAGSGVAVAGNYMRLNLYTDLLISRETVRVADGGGLMITGYPHLPSSPNQEPPGGIQPLSQGRELPKGIWVKNIMTQNNMPQGYANNTNYINISGDCYVADDMTLNARNGNVRISGSYWGYNVGTLRYPQYSSSIAINTPMATLDMRGTYIWLAGKNYVSTLKSYGNTLTYGSLGPPPEGDVPIMTGESLAYKGTQSAYLIPGDVIVSSKYRHNPMTVAEYTELIDNDTGSVPLNIYNESLTKGIKLSDYLNSNKPYIPVFVQYVPSGSTSNINQMVYLYMNFLTQDTASDYYSEYARVHGDSDYLNVNDSLYGDNYLNSNDNVANAYGLGQILLNEGQLVNTGNVTIYVETSGQNKIKSIARSDTYGVDYYGNPFNPMSSNSSDITKKQADLTFKYRGLITKLDWDYRAADIETPVTSRIVNYERMRLDANTRGLSISDANVVGTNVVCYEKGFMDEDEDADEKVFALVAYGDVTLTDVGCHVGIVIASGNVTIKSGAFRGLIIAGGNVVLEGSAEHWCANLTEIEDLIQNEYIYLDISKYFVDYSTIGGRTAGSDVVNKGVVISYENWKKNIK